MRIYEIAQITNTKGKRVSIYYDMFEETVISESNEILEEEVWSKKEAVEIVIALYGHEIWELELL